MFKVATLLGLFVSTAVVSQATLIAYEPFDYTLSESLSDQAGGFGFSGGWSTVNSDNGTITVEEGLSYPDLPTAGGSIFMAPTASVVSSKRDLTSPINSGTLYTSFLVNITEGKRYLGLTLRDNYNYLSVGQSTGKNTWCITNSNGSSTTSYSSSSNITYNTTYLLVLRVDFDASGTQERLRLYVNPDLSSGEEPGTAAIDVLGEYNVPSITAAGVQAAYTLAGTSYTTAKGYIDEIRLGDSYMDVIPESSSTNFLGLTLFGVLLGRAICRKIRSKSVDDKNQPMI